jgi:hypothetical protein
LAHRIDGSPGSHPHADQPNWRPATTIDEYLKNCREGLEIFSDRRFAKLMGWSRMMVWRARLFNTIPRDLLDRLIEGDPPASVTAIAHIGQALASGSFGVDIERCPHCNGLLRRRQHVADVHARIVLDWIDEARPRDAPVSPA